MRWGRKHTRDSVEESRLQVEQSLQDAVAGAGEVYQVLMEQNSQFTDVLDEIEAQLGHGDGLPADAVRKQLDDARQMVAGIDGYGDQVQYYRQSTGQLLDLDFEEFQAAVDDLQEFVEGMTSVGEELAGLTLQMVDMLKKLLQLRDDLVPIRERIHASHAAAVAGLAGTSTYVKGRHGIEARVHAAGDRLRALDEGRVTPTPERKVTDAYRELEAEIAEIRDEITELAR